jgi:hypothetical protein
LVTSHPTSTRTFRSKCLLTTSINYPGCKYDGENGRHSANGIGMLLISKTFARSAIRNAHDGQGAG